MRNKENAFTLLELISVLVIMAVIAFIAAPLILALINKAKVSANKRSVDAYGKALELSVFSYLMDTGKYPEDLTALTVEYTGKEVICNVMQLKENGTVYLSECSVGGKEIKDSDSEDGFYHYGKKEVVFAVPYLLSKANNIKVIVYDENSVTKHQMYTFAHDATEQTESLTDYRYIGSDPYNYVTFNNELWRIIGVFTVEDEKEKKVQRLKLIREETIGSYSWASDFSNEWSASSLQLYLNNQYYESLTAEAQSMIAISKFYLGSGTEIGYYSDYINERSKWTEDSSRSINWLGKVGLMYSSDYSYTYASGVDDGCFYSAYRCNFEGDPSNGWLFKSTVLWAINPVGVNDAVSIDATGSVNVGNYGGVLASCNVYPTLYLSSNVQIIGGDGSISKPYQLSL